MSQEPPHFDTAGSRPPAPSAADGWRRLQKTQAVARTVSPHAPDAAALPVRAPRRMARFVGGARLAGMVAVLALIVASSVTMARSDRHHDAHPTPGAKTSRSTSDAAAASSATPSDAIVATRPAADVRVVHVTKRAARRPARTAGAAAHTPASSTRRTARAHTVSTAAATRTTTPVPITTSTAMRVTLPYTGTIPLEHVVLGGALLVLLGMLVQIAGQPLPARAASRQRSRAGR